MCLYSLRLAMAGIAVLLLTATTGYGGDVENTPEETAVAHFPVSHYRFDTVVDGTAVIYDFVVQNKGSAPLHIENVRTG